MADFRPDLVEAAYAELGVTASRSRAAHNRWQSMLISTRAPRGLSLYQAVLGPPDDDRTESLGEVSLTAHAWRLPGLWPDLRFEALVGLDDVVLHDWLVRAPDSPVPTLPEPERLAPWSCVVGDAVARFPGARQVEGEAPSRWRVDVGPHKLIFVYGLLPTVL